MKEGNILKRIQVALSNIGARVFRNNVGKLKDRNGQWVAYGVCNPGGSDLIGWKTILVTEDMIGRDFAVFVACEVKGEKGKLTPEQIIFIANVKAAGGIAFMARSPEEAVQELEDFTR